MLESGFREAAAEVVPIQPDLECTSTYVSSDANWSDSDDEEEDANIHPVHSLTHPGHKFHSVKIVDFSPTTFQAALVWIVTRHVKFASLSEVQVGPQSVRADLGTSRNLKTREATPAPPKQPSADIPPVSCKSLYRLADVLDLPVLKQLELENFKSQLTASNIAVQLYSSTSIAHDEIRAACLEFATEHWDEVSKTEGLASVKARVVSEEISGSEAVTFQLMEAFAAKAAPAKG